MVTNCKVMDLKRIIENTIRQQLNEITSRFVYHWASPKTAWKIIDSNSFSLMSTLFKGSESNLVGASHNHLYYMSLTRNGKIGQGGYSNSIHPWVRFTLDGDVLNSRFHIKALDYWGKSMGKNYRMSGEMSKVMNPYAKQSIMHKPSSETESEDRLYSNQPMIRNVFKYIKHIDLYFPIDDMDESDMNSLPYIYNILINYSKRCTLYKTIEDFNNNKNAINSNEFFDWYRENEFKYEHRYSSREDVNVPVRFLASVLYLVNFPYGTFKDCMSTLKKYGLEKYANTVAKELNGQNDRYYHFDFMNSRYNTSKGAEQILYGVINGTGLLYDIQLHNNAQSMNREDLSKGYKILSDFCKKHKLKTINDIGKYLIDIVKQNNGESDMHMRYTQDNSHTINIPCVHVATAENKYFVCMNPKTQLYTDVIVNGKDYLQFLYDDIAYYVNHSSFNHKSKDNRLFLNYIKRVLNKPTIQDVMNFYDKLYELGNTSIDNDLRPTITEKSLNQWQLDSLTFNGEYANHVYLKDDTSVVLQDKTQIPQLIDLWNDSLENGLT